MDSIDRQELYEAYNKLCEGYETVKHILGHEARSDKTFTHTYENLKAYSLGGIESGLKAEEYHSTHSTIKSIIEDLGIMDDCGEFLEEEEEGEGL